MKSQRWQDWVMLIFGIWLIIAPFWIVGYASTDSIAAWNSYILGALVALFAWAALASPQKWQEWIQLVLGIWLLISPFVLVFYNSETGAAWNVIILGILVVLDSIWALGTRPEKRVRA